MRGRLVPLFALLVVFVTGCSTAGAQEDEETTPEGTVPGTEVSGTLEDPRPNVVFVLADDLSQGLVEDHPGAFPNLRELKADGVTFDNFFVTDPVCCPARASYLTGEYKHNHGVDMGGGASAFRPLDERALPVWIDNAGYKTSYYGKYINGYSGTYRPTGWDLWRGVVITDGGQVSKAEAGDDTLVEGYDRAGFNSSGQTHTQVFASQAAEFVQRSHESGEPFFAYVAPYAPHKPSAHPKTYDRLFRAVKAPRTAAFNEKVVDDKPHWVSDRQPLSDAQIAKIDETYREMMRSTKDVDDLLGTIVASLKESGEYDNTYIAFSSDNGFHYGQHRLMAGKWTPYEEDLRVPLVISGPGVPQGETRTGLALNNDLAPTFADWTGATPSEAANVDGRSLVPLIASDSTPWRDAFAIEAIRSEESRFTRPPFVGVRTARYLYAEYKSGEKELYDLRKDPDEMRNLAGERPVAQRFLAARLEKLKMCSGDSCRAAEGP